jgi:hypothetical protein
MGYMKLIKARDTEMAGDIVDYDGEDTVLLDMYVTADEGDADSIYKKELGKAEAEAVEVVIVVGASWGGVQCYTDTVEAYRDEAGDLWLAEHQFKEVFSWC